MNSRRTGFYSPTPCADSEFVPLQIWPQRRYIFAQQRAEASVLSSEVASEEGARVGVQWRAFAAPHVEAVDRSQGPHRPPHRPLPEARRWGSSLGIRR